MSIDIREHGGSYVGGKKQLFGKGVIKQTFKPSFNTSPNSPNVRCIGETKSFIWHIFENTFSKFIVQTSKSNAINVKIAVISPTVPTGPTSLIPLYDLDKVVVVTSTGYWIINTGLTFDYNGSSMITTNVDMVKAYYFKTSTNVLYFSIIAGNQRRIIAINLTTITSPTIIYNIIVMTHTDSLSNTYVAFEPERDAVRIYHPAITFNCRYNLSNGSLIASYGSTIVTPQYSPIAIDRSNYDIMFMIDSNGAKKINLATNSILVGATSMSISSQIQPFLPSMTLIFDNYPSSYCKRLANGNYIGYFGAKFNSGTYAPTVLVMFIMDSNLNVIGAEFNQASDYNSQQPTSMQDMNSYDNFIYNNLNVGGGQVPEIHFLN